MICGHRLLPTLSPAVYAMYVTVWYAFLLVSTNPVRRTMARYIIGYSFRTYAKLYNGSMYIVYCYLLLSSTYV